MNKLIVIDMQEDFNPSAEVTARVVSKINHAMVNNEPIYFTMDEHDAGTYEKYRESKYYPPHCVSGSKGSHLVAPVGEVVALYRKKYVFEKDTFASIDLANGLLAVSAPDDVIELCGVCTDICVISNALMLRALLPFNRIVVDATACEGTTPELHKTALEVMKKNAIEVKEQWQ